MKKIATNTKLAFTLAEILITLAVIGVLAAITIPLLKNNTDDKILDTQQKTFVKKLSKGMHAMQLDGALAETYDTTTDFVNTMKLRKSWAWGYIIPQHESSLFRVPWF